MSVLANSNAGIPVYISHYGRLDSVVDLTTALDEKLRSLEEEEKAKNTSKTVVGQTSDEFVGDSGSCYSGEEDREVTLCNSGDEHEHAFLDHKEERRDSASPLPDETLGDEVDGGHLEPVTSGSSVASETIIEEEEEEEEEEEPEPEESIYDSDVRFTCFGDMTMRDTRADETGKKFSTNLEQIGTLCNGHSLGARIGQAGMELYRMADDLPEFDNARCDVVMASCIFVACREYHARVDFEKIQDMCLVPRVMWSLIDSTYKSIEKILAHKGGLRRIASPETETESRDTSRRSSVMNIISLNSEAFAANQRNAATLNWRDSNAMQRPSNSLHTSLIRSRCYSNESGGESKYDRVGALRGALQSDGPGTSRPARPGLNWAWTAV